MTIIFAPQTNQVHEIYFRRAMNYSVANSTYKMSSLRFTFENDIVSPTYSVEMSKFLGHSDFT